MTNQLDVAIVGGGIVGLAQAWMASRQGARVGLFERSSVAQGATVRNFGMIWPIGQPAGELYDVALKSRQFWLELNSAGALEVEQCGSIHLAHHEDELQVLDEFISKGTHEAELISAEEVCQRSKLANPKGLLGGMYSESELRVNPRVAANQIRLWLESQCHIDMHFNTQITSIEGHELQSSEGDSWHADKIIVCSGSDLQTLYPEEFDQSGLVLCKLQMLKTTAQSGSRESVVPHIASGLTLRHYSSFLDCPSLELVKERVSAESPLLDKYGIHVMASQFPSGEVILGDSHEYGSDISPFDKAEIDALMLDELRKVIQLDDWSIREKWHGIYSKHKQLPIYEKQVNDAVSLFVGTGGAGMTMSFGLANRYWEQNS